MAAELTDERAAFAQYLKDCDENAIVPDVAGAFHWAWVHATQQATQGAEPVATVRIEYEGGHQWPVADFHNDDIADGAPLYTALPPAAAAGKDAALRLARAHIKWLAFGECRADGWEGAPPTALQAVDAINAALATQGAEPVRGELDPRTALEHARSMTRYVQSFNGQTFSPALDSADRQNLATALDNLEETSAMLLNMASRTAPPLTAEVEKKAARYDWLLRAIPAQICLDALGIQPCPDDEIGEAIDAALQSDQAQAGKG